MTISHLTLIEAFVAVIGACALWFWAGRLSRDKEVKRLSETVDVLNERADGLAAHSDGVAQERDQWRARAEAAETQLASLPKRGATGQFQKRSGLK